MIKFLKFAITVLSGVRLIPLIPFLLFCSQRMVLKSDLQRFASVYHLGTLQSTKRQIITFIYVMTWLPEFRNIFYLRTGLPAKCLSFLCRRKPSLQLGGTTIGRGLFILHGDGTLVAAASIGENCWIGQQVVIGYSNETDIPTIGSNVQIHAGAKIVGKVSVGDNAVIGANSVVIANVPPGATVMGVPGRILLRKPPTEDREGAAI